MITTDNVLNAVPKNLKINIPFTLGILNSRLLSWLYVNTSMIAQKDDFPQVHISALAALPIPKYDRSRNDHLVKLVEQILGLQIQLQKAKTPHEKEALQREIIGTDKQIDQIVYQLYGLNAEEIKIVEEAN
jgi:hypothetical protein